ncbi:uncharacterized mitochondrial protein AtMg00310-like [Primulina eburnea]|uniref:uncharacterized mitochondrial protein AtMg00310-like n=1 Tax=Primulina eburnea TaxID=1245227 RepID=UPI003C6C0164
MIDFIKTCLTIPVVQGHELYLGLPTFSLRSKNIQFSYLKDKVVKKMQGWGNKIFSVGGKEVLIKSVLQSIPTYAMACFKIPDAICADIERACANFWWGLDKGRKRMHWTTWKELCRPKRMGGMGFKDLKLFNKSLIAKQIWRLVQNPNSLVARVLKGRYHRHVDIMEAQLGNNPSFIWRSFVWGRELLREGLYWRIGDGKHIGVFHHRWVHDLADPIPFAAAELSPEAHVAELITGKEWNTNMITRNFMPYYS